MNPRIFLPPYPGFSASEREYLKALTQPHINHYGSELVLVPSLAPRLQHSKFVDMQPEPLAASSFSVQFSLYNRSTAHLYLTLPTFNLSSGQFEIPPCPSTHP